MPLQERRFLLQGSAVARAESGRPQFPDHPSVLRRGMHGQLTGDGIEPVSLPAQKAVQRLPDDRLFGGTADARNEKHL
jgi:hypothetical protein